MVSKFPKTLYTNQQKYAIIRENAKIYQKARKKVKTEILNELTNILKFNRDYLAYVSCQKFCVWFTSFKPNFKLKSCNISSHWILNSGHFYHHKEDRIKSHILVCILSYLLQITLENLLKKKGYNFTFREFVNKVREVRAVELEVKKVKKRDIKLTEIQEEIKRILMDLNMEDLMYENFIKNLI